MSEKQKNTKQPGESKEGSSATIKAAYITAAGAVIVALISTFGSGGSGPSINQTIGDSGAVNTGNGNVHIEKSNQK